VDIRRVLLTMEKKIGPLIYTLPYSMLVTAHIYMELTVVGWIPAQTFYTEF